MRSGETERSSEEGSLYSSGDESFIAPEDSDASVVSDSEASYRPPPAAQGATASSVTSDLSCSDPHEEASRSSPSQTGEGGPLVLTDRVPTGSDLPRPVPSLPAPVPVTPALSDNVTTRYPKRERRAVQDVYLDANIRRVRRVLEADERRDLIREARDWNDAPASDEDVGDAEANVRGVSTAVLRSIHSAVAARNNMPAIDDADVEDDTDADAESDSSA